MFILMCLQAKTSKFSTKFVMPFLKKRSRAKSNFLTCDVAWTHLPASELVSQNKLGAPRMGNLTVVAEFSNFAPKIYDEQVWCYVASVA